MSLEVRTMEELKIALASDVAEIVSYDDDVVSKLKAVKLAQSWGPIAIAAIVAAVPLVLTTGPAGAGLIAAAAPSAGVAVSTIVALIIAIGGVIAVNLFTDWDYVELPGGIKMERKKT